MRNQNLLKKRVLLKKLNHNFRQNQFKISECDFYPTSRELHVLISHFNLNHNK
jgi:hypothetical protein